MPLGKMCGSSISEGLTWTLYRRGSARSPCCGWIPSLAQRNSSHRRETSSRLRRTASSTKNPHGKQRLKCPSPTMWSTE
ncbi:hypothetical protein MRX96_008647 [Rhipicephalus microplus]